jgi:hypothetical protein
MSIGITEQVGRTMAQFPVMPADLIARALQRRYPLLKGLRASGAERDVSKA